MTKYTCQGLFYKSFNSDSMILQKITISSRTIYHIDTKDSKRHDVVVTFPGYSFLLELERCTCGKGHKSSKINMNMIMEVLIQTILFLCFIIFCKLEQISYFTLACRPCSLIRASAVSIQAHWIKTRYQRRVNSSMKVYVRIQTLLEYSNTLSSLSLLNRNGYTFKTGLQPF